MPISTGMLVPTEVVSIEASKMRKKTAYSQNTKEMEGWNIVKSKKGEVIEIRGC